MATGGNFINLDEIVRNAAWDKFDSSATGKQKKLRQKDKGEQRKYLHLEIDWSETTFHDETQWSPLRTDDQAATDEPSTVGGQNNVNTHARRDVAPTSGQPRASVLFQTRFTNNTKGPQEYTMKTEKKTKSSMSSTVEHGFTKGVEMTVKLALPGEVFEANAGYKREITLTNASGETFEEELTWGVESQIRVDEGHVAEASLVVDERRQAGDFVIVTKISGPVYATFTAPRDNNSLVKATCDLVSNIVAEYLRVEQRKGRTVEHIRVDGDTVVIQTRGTCRFRYGIKQEIRVDQKPLNDVK